MNYIKYIMRLVFIFGLFSVYGQAQSMSDFLGHWSGTEELSSPTSSYENRNISIVEKASMFLVLHLSFFTMKTLNGHFITLDMIRVKLN